MSLTNYMPFKLLKQVITHLRKNSDCLFCHAKFNEDLIFVLASSYQLEEDLGHAIFLVVCPSCHAEAFMMVEVGKEIRVQATSPAASGTAISVNEVLDMHNLLKNWKGEDIHELFDA